MDLGTGIEALTYELVMASTIKTIDPKYLPNGGSSGGGGGELPVIDLIALGMDFSEVDTTGNEAMEQYVLPEVEAELISKLTALKPVVVKFALQGIPMDAILNPTTIHMDSESIYTASTASYPIGDAMVYSLRLEHSTLWFISTVIR